ncbi:hypothetical protein P8452_36478 [Trifolium repens]|nr:hypothetical protein P8452_36478 [Trifolium repens]
MHQRGDERVYKGKQPEYKPKEQVCGAGGEAKQGGGAGGQAKHGVSFKQCLVNANTNNHKGDGGKKSYTKKNFSEKQILEGTMEVTVVEENLKKYESCWVGKLWDHNDVDQIQFKIWMEGFQMVKTIWLGLDLVLLSSDVQDGVKIAVEATQIGGVGVSLKSNHGIHY